MTSSGGGKRRGEVALQQLGIVAQGGIQQVKVFDDHPPAGIHCRPHSLGQAVRLGEGRFKAHIHMIGVIPEAARFKVIHQRQRTGVYILIVVGQLQSGKHSPHDEGLAAARLSQNTDAPVLRGKILAGDGVAQLQQAFAAPGGVVFGIHKGIAGKFQWRHLLSGSAKGPHLTLYAKAPGVAM